MVGLQPTRLLRPWNFPGKSTGIKIARRNINNLRYAVERQWQLIPVLLPGKFQGRRSLVGCSPTISITSDRQMTPPLWQKVKKN